MISEELFVVTVCLPLPPFFYSLRQPVLELREAPGVRHSGGSIRGITAVYYGKKWAIGVTRTIGIPYLFGG